MSRQRSIRTYWLFLGLVVSMAAAAGPALAQGWGPNPYAPQLGGMAPGLPAYGAGYPGYTTSGPPPWSDDRARPNYLNTATSSELSSTSSELSSTFSEAAVPTIGARRGLGSGFLYTGGAANAAAPNAHIGLAPVFTHVRLNLDAAWDNPTPDRAEYFQGKSGVFRTAPAPFTDPDAPGPAMLETNVDYQDIRGYLEVAIGPIFSGFVELPYRFIDPERNHDTSGFADMNAGFKAALLAADEDYLTFQLTTYFPTGDADRGLGTSHLTVEPALLFYERYTDRLAFYGELRYWIPIDGTNFAGEIVRYGVGTGYDLGYGRGTSERVTALVELVNWTITHGGVFNGNNPLAGVQDVADDTIVNLVGGLRYTLGTGSFAATWSRSLSDPVWSEDLLRLEYRRAY
jgi:hypothetical protein